MGVGLGQKCPSPVIYIELLIVSILAKHPDPVSVSGQTDHTNPKLILLVFDRAHALAEGFILYHRNYGDLAVTSSTRRGRRYDRVKS